MKTDTPRGEIPNPPTGKGYQKAFPPCFHEHFPQSTTADLRGALKTRAHTPRVAITEPKAIGGLLRAIDDFPGAFIVKSGLHLLALTFLRPSEVHLANERKSTLPTNRTEMFVHAAFPLSISLIRYDISCPSFTLVFGESK